MKRILAWILVVTVSVVVGAVAIAFLSSNGEVPAADIPAAVDVDGTVEVTRRDVSAVISLDSVAVANPQYDVVAPKSGTITYLLEKKNDSQQPAPRLDPTPTPSPDPTPTSDPDPDPTETPSPDPSPDPTDPSEPADEPEPEWTAIPVKAGDSLWQSSDGKATKAPVDGVFLEWLVPSGTKVKKGTPVARLSYAGFAMVGALPAIDTYRLLDSDLTATGGIPDGPVGFECTLLQAPAVAASEGDTSTPQIICAVDDDVRLFVDLSGRIILNSGLVENVLTLPVTAVSGGAEQGEVTVVHDDGSSEIRTVRLGATDGAVVEIVEGLDEGDRVSASPPPLVR